MIDRKAIFRNFRDVLREHGWFKSFLFYCCYVLKKIIPFQLVYFVALDRECLAPRAWGRQYSGRLAALEDLLKMQREGTWDISRDKIEAFQQGDACVLSYLDGDLAGYTFVHGGGRPLLAPGFRISVPSSYLYNYAGFTAPRFRGHGLQSYRHGQVLSMAEWKDKKGLIAYVDSANWSSQQGLAKSGYRRLGAMWMIGRNGRFLSHVASQVRRFGIQRIPA